MLLGALLRALLPGCVALRAGAIAAHVGPIWPEEAARVARAADGRRAEFAAGRSLARQALADLGITDSEAQALGLRIYKVALTWPLEQAAEAHAMVEGGDVVGRVVLKP